RARGSPGKAPVRGRGRAEARATARAAVFSAWRRRAGSVWRDRRPHGGPGDRLRGGDAPAGCAHTVPGRRAWRPDRHRWAERGGQDHPAAHDCGRAVAAGRGPVVRKRGPDRVPRPAPRGRDPGHDGSRAWRSALAEGWTVNEAAQTQARRLLVGGPSRASTSAPSRASIFASSGDANGSSDRSAARRRAVPAGVASTPITNTREKKGKLSKDVYRRQLASVEGELTRLG